MKKLITIASIMLMAMCAVGQRIETEQYIFKNRVDINSTNLFLGSTNFDAVVNSLSNNVANLEGRTNDWNDVSNKITEVQSTNIATSVHTFYQTNYIALYTTTNDGYGDAKIIIDGNLGDRFFWDGASQTITNDITANTISLYATNGADMKGIVICLKQGDPAFTLHLESGYGFGFSLDFPENDGNKNSTTAIGGLDYMGLRKRPLSNIWDIQGWQKGF